MKTFTLTEAKEQLGAVLEKAKAGQAIEITRYGKPVFQFQGGDCDRAAAGKLPARAAHLRALACIHAAAQAQGRPRCKRDAR